MKRDSSTAKEVRYSLRVSSFYGVDPTAERRDQSGEIRRLVVDPPGEFDFDLQFRRSVALVFDLLFHALSPNAKGCSQSSEVVLSSPSPNYSPSSIRSSPAFSAPR